MLLLDAAHHHAEMPRLDHHANSLRFDRLLDRLGNLSGQPLLNLEPPRENLNQPRNLAETNDFSIRNISHVYLAEEWQHVVLTQAEHLYILYDHHLVIRNGEQSLAQQSLGIFFVSPREKLIRLLDSLRRADESLAIRILTEANKHLPHEIFITGARQGGGLGS